MIPLFLPFPYRSFSHPHIPVARGRRTWGGGGGWKPGNTTDTALCNSMQCIM